MLSPSDLKDAHVNGTAVDNDFHQTHAIFSLFEGLEAEDLGEALVNGHQSNGINNPNAHDAPKEKHH